VMATVRPLSSGQTDCAMKADGLLK